MALVNGITVTVLLFLIVTTNCDNLRKSSSVPARDEKRIKPAAKNEGDDSVIIRTEEGLIRGATVAGEGADKLCVFRSIPYAKPPIGELRFSNPQRMDPWDGILDTRNRPNICIQASFLGGHNGYEDCLYLEVTVPKTAVSDRESSLLPVMFFIYGGSFQVGDSEEGGFFDPKMLAEKYNVIVVIPNYRLGIFGFLAHEQLRRNDQDGSTGNMGLVDQRTALEWAHANIGYFGGDPEKVTIFGESSGAISVCAHYANGKRNEGLFRAAIMQSGNCDSPDLFQNAEAAMQYGKEYSDSIGCENGEGYLECVRNKTVNEILRGHVQDEKNPVFGPLISFTPTVDGTDIGIPIMPLSSIQQGKHNKIPLIIGTNKDEGTVFAPEVQSIVPDTNYPLDEEDMPKIMHHLLDPHIGYLSAEKKIQHILNILYPIDDFENIPNNQFSAIFRDYMFQCPSRRAAKASSDTYRYYFSYGNHWLEVEEFGTFHSLDLYFVFGNGKSKVMDPFVLPRDLEMRDVFQQYWTSLAKTEYPNGDCGGCDVEWPPYHRGDAIMKLDIPLEVIDLEEEKDFCDFWDEVYSEYHHLNDSHFTLFDSFIF